MALAAATATRHGHLSPLVIVLIVVALIAGWLVSLWWHPYASCGWCDDGKNKGSTGKRYGRCWRCKGQPERLRRGARLMHRNIGGK